MCDDVNAPRRSSEGDKLEDLAEHIYLIERTQRHTEKTDGVEVPYSISKVMKSKSYWMKQVMQLTSLQENVAESEVIIEEFMIRQMRLLRDI